MAGLGDGKNGPQSTMVQEGYYKGTVTKSNLFKGYYMVYRVLQGYKKVTKRMLQGYHKGIICLFSEFR